jgi:hypothetical protein
MSAQFIVEYNGAPVKFNGTQIELVPETQASVFTDEAGAWWSAYQAQLNPLFLEVRSRDLSSGRNETVDYLTTAPVVPATAAGKFSNN